MTYQEIVDNFREICRQHEIIREFGYGAISDIKTMNTNLGISSVEDPKITQDETLYPYVYLVPGQSTRTSQSITYRFNMIVMDTVLPNGLEVVGYGTIDQKDPPYGTTLEVQSACQQYVDDILAKLRLGRGQNNTGAPLKYPLMDAQLQVNLTPFKERFQDTVAGMTATIELEVAQPLDLCIAPIKDQYPELIESRQLQVLADQSYNYTNIADQWDIPEAEADYRIEWNFGVSKNVLLSNDPSPNDEIKFTIYEENDGGMNISRYLVEQPINGAIGEEVRVAGQVEFTTRDLPPDSRQIFFGFGYLQSTYPDGAPTTEVPNAINLEGGFIRIYKN